MKTILIAFFAALLLLGCSAGKEAARSSAKVVAGGSDSSEYSIVVIDPHFDQWFAVNYSEPKDRSAEYYRTKNLSAVSNWNQYFRTGRYSRVIDSLIDYQPDIDYGIEVNRKLFWYFTYVESYYGVKGLW